MSVGEAGKRVKEKDTRLHCSRLSVKISALRIWKIVHSFDGGIIIVAMRESVRVSATASERKDGGNLLY